MSTYYEFAYTLSEKEVAAGLRTTGKYKTMGVKGMVETAILVAFGAFFLYGFITKGQIMELIMAVVCAAVIAVLNLAPRIDIKKQSQNGQVDLSLRVYPDFVYVYTDDSTTRIELAKSKIRYSAKEKVTSIIPDDGGLLIIPNRAIPSENSGRIRAIINSNE